jgi:hypothetical protein
MTDYNDGKWHGWNGGECPVHPRSRIEWTRKTAIGSYGQPYQGECPASGAGWREFDGVPHINAFRVVKAYREPRDFWITIYDGMAWDFKEQAEKNAHDGMIVHVREVLE